MNVKINKLKRYIDESSKIVFLTGAGVSTHSGIPDYRSANGLYSGIPEYMLSQECLTKEYHKFIEFIRNKFNFVNVEPNDIHKWIASLDSKKDVTVITQNVDGLHQKAGSINVINYHGDVNKWRCVRCDNQYGMQYAIENYFCTCKSPIRPNVVLYGENPSELDDTRAVKALEESDLVIVIGTSLNVYPFADLITMAHPFALSVLINKEEPANFASSFNLKFICDALDVLKEVY